MNHESMIIKFEHSGEQCLGRVTKIVGLVQAKYIARIIDYLDLDANPRNSKTGPVTAAIQESILNDPELFPFKTKGILLAAADYKRIGGGEYEITVKNPALEGILDGGHNTLAIGLFILEGAYRHIDKTFPRGTKSWTDFKMLWEENRELVTEFLFAPRVTAGEFVADTLDFYVPVELLVPGDPENQDCVQAFSSRLLDINAARNNNAQLAVSAVANQKGYFDDLRQMMEDHDPELCKRIEWKTNAGGTIKVQDIVALAWIPLGLVPPVKNKLGKVIEPPAMNKLYSGKSSVLKTFERFMASPDVTASCGDYRCELSNATVRSALSIAVQIPELYDYIYENLPSLYNAASGSYGRILAVKELNKSKQEKVTPYLHRKVECKSPNGYVMPLVCGLREIMELSEVDGAQVVRWRVDPMAFLEENLPAIVATYKDSFAPWNWDPQKIGKSSASYSNVANAYKMALAGIL